MAESKIADHNDLGPGVFAELTPRAYPDNLGVPHDGVCQMAYRPDTAVLSALPVDGVMVVSASHNDGGAVAITGTPPCSAHTGSPALPDNDLPSITFPCSQTEVTGASDVGPCADIYAPGNLLLSICMRRLVPPTMRPTFCPAA